ncbi:MAG: cytochrome bc complex cytochrome b subunit, partial [Nitrospinae bacterium]|nr:cytochrome bc complex cytochrome b subunit [Nitrospinota bacterium]
FNTPEHIKPEWYFLAPYQFLKLIPELTALVVQTLGILALVFLPFLERSDKKGIRQRPLFSLLAIGILVFWIWLTVWGAQS